MALKLGLMVPANNTTMEPELCAWLDGAACRTLRIPRGKGLLGRAEIPAYVEQALARDTMTPEAEAMFLACSQLSTKSIIDGLQREFGRPVWSSIRATAWQVQHMPAGAPA